MTRSPLTPIVIFVRPQAEGNIGALSRAMANFSAGELRLVGAGVANPMDADHPFAKIDWALAKRGEHILQSARWHPSLQAALEGVDLVVGTSGRDREFENSYARPLLNAGEGFSLVQKTFAALDPAAQRDFRWALVLGPENDGLNSEELACCHSLVHIHTSEECPSMNIAVAAACLLYHAQEFFRAHWQQPQPVNVEAFPQEHVQENSLTKFDEKEAFVSYVVQTLSLTSFFKYPDQAAVSARLRRVLQSVQLPRGELLFLFEVIYQLKCWGQGRFEERNFLNKKC